MEIKIRRMVWKAREKLEEVRLDLEEVQNNLIPFNKDNEDKLKWAMAKISDLERLLISIK